MHINSLVAILLLATSVASADVSISSSYFTSETECHEDVFLHNMDYSNSVTIDQANFNAASNASEADESGTGQFVQNARMSSEIGSQGAGIAVSANDLGYSRSLSGGASKLIGLSFFLESGTAHSSFFSPKSLFNEQLVLNNCSYKGDIQVYNMRPYSLGYGTPVSDAPSSFYDEIYMNYLDKQCKLWSSLITFDKESNDVPVNYTLRSYAAERTYARAGIGIEASPGNRIVKLKINGTATYLEDKSSPDPKINKTPRDDFPFKYVPISEYIPPMPLPKNAIQVTRDFWVEYSMREGIPDNVSTK